MGFLTLDKTFVQDNFRFVQDKKYFVRADGRGIWKQKIAHAICPDKTFFVLDKSEIVLDKNFVQG